MIRGRKIIILLVSIILLFVIAVTLDNSLLTHLNHDDMSSGNNEEIIDTKNVKLYFADKDGNLSDVWGEVKISDTVSVGQMVVEELINGPQDSDLLPVLSSDLKILSFEVTDGTAYVNMPQSFIDKNKVSDKASRLAVSSIVNSLCELDMIENVQFLIDGKKIQGFETIDISEPLTKN